MKRGKLRNAGLISALFLFLSCEGGFFRVALEGQDGSAAAGLLAIHPAAATLAIERTLNFSATGGDGVYSYSLISGNGGLKGSLYTAPDQAGTERVRVTDGAGATAEAVITVKAAYCPDYRVAASPVFPATGEGGAACVGSFVIENIAEEPGQAPNDVSWTLYVSRDETLDDLDLSIDSGSLPPLAANALSETVSFDGVWPVAAGAYYLIIELNAADDLIKTNDIRTSASINVNGAARPAYSITTIATPADGLCTAHFTESLVVENTGAGAGSEEASWKVYLSKDASLDDSDEMIDAGSIAANLASGGSDTISFAGDFPASPGAYYFIAVVSAFDDTATGTKTLASELFIVSGPNYTAAISAPTEAQSAGQNFTNLAFTITNEADSGGLRDIDWSVFASLGDASIDASDILLASGSAAALAAGGSVSPTFNGVWPTEAGIYYLIVRLHAADDATDAETASGSFTVVGPDYSVSAIADPNALSAGVAFTSQLTIANAAGAGTGLKDIDWSVYASADNTYDAGDILLDSGSFTNANFPANSTQIVDVSAIWPAEATSYYLVAAVSAADDASVSHYASGPHTVVGPDYSVSAIADPNTLSAGAAFSCSMTLANTGLGNGAENLYWSVYISQDSSLGDGDIYVASGTHGALNASSLAIQNFSGGWPATAGDYYLICTLYASDDPTSYTYAAASNVLTITL